MSEISNIGPIQPPQKPQPLRSHAGPALLVLQQLRQILKL